MGRNSRINSQSRADAISSSCGTRQRSLRMRCESIAGAISRREASSFCGISPDNMHWILIMSDMESAVVIWSLYLKATNSAQSRAFVAIFWRSSMAQLLLFRRFVMLPLHQPQRRATSLRGMFPDLMHWILISCLISMWWLLINWRIDFVRYYVS